MLGNRVFSLCKACAVLVANKSGNLNAKIGSTTSSGPPNFWCFEGRSGYIFKV